MSAKPNGFKVLTLTDIGYVQDLQTSLEMPRIASIVMIVGIAIIGIFISTLGARLMESRLKAKKQSIPKLSDQAKGLIKDKIDEHEKLDDEDINTLMAVIKSLNNTLHKSNPP